MNRRQKRPLWDEGITRRAPFPTCVSLPAYAHRRLTVKAYPDRICIYFENELIARHQRRFGDEDFAAASGL